MQPAAIVRGRKMLQLSKTSSRALAGFVAAAGLVLSLGAGVAMAQTPQQAHPAPPPVQAGRPGPEPPEAGPKPEQAGGWRSLAFSSA
jgi:hypothetical protein